MEANPTSNGKARLMFGLQLGRGAHFCLSKRLGYMSRRDHARNASEARNHGHAAEASPPRLRSEISSPPRQIHSTLPLARSFIFEEKLHFLLRGRPPNRTAFRPSAARALRFKGIARLATCEHDASQNRESGAKSASKHEIFAARRIAADKRSVSKSCFAARDEKL